MVLIVHRIQPVNGQRPPVVSDEHWQRWTGLKPRMKEMAIRGLKQKGLSVSGTGQRARYYFDAEMWERWVRSQSPEQKARTEGRATSPKPGQKIHTDCVKNGCQRLCEAKCEEPKVISITRESPDPYVEEPKNAQPVARNPANSLILGSKKRTNGEDRIYGREGEDFTGLLSAFLACGVKLSKADIERCRKLWTQLKAEEKTTALAYALARTADDWSKRELRYVPRPWNYLERKDWERRGPDRKEPEKWNPFT